MAYISSEQVKEMREKIKELFPTKNGWKFSIRRLHHSTVSLTIERAPVRFIEESIPNRSLNTYYLERYNNSDILLKLKAILMDGNFDKSDSQTDYFHVGWYIDMNIGSHVKPFELFELKPAVKNKSVQMTQLYNPEFKISVFNEIVTHETMDSDLKNGYIAPLVEIVQRNPSPGCFV